MSTYSINGISIHESSDPSGDELIFGAVTFEIFAPYDTLYGEYPYPESSEVYLVSVPGREIWSLGYQDSSGVFHELNLFDYDYYLYNVVFDTGQVGKFANVSWTETNADGTETSVGLTFLIGGETPEPLPMTMTEYNDFIESMTDSYLVDVNPETGLIEEDMSLWNGVSIDLNDYYDDLFPGRDDLIDVGAGDDYVATGDGDDWVWAGSGDDVVHTGSGDDFVDSGKGRDYVDLGDGYDHVVAGGGQEEFHGGADVDLIDYHNSAGGVTVNLATNEVSGSWASNDVISGFESVIGSNTGDDVIYGTSGANEIYTYGGDDIVFAGKGSDYVDLGDGNDAVFAGGGQEEFRGGAGMDHISYYDSTGGVTVNLATNEVSGSWAANDIISGFERISGSGTGGDTIFGTSGANMIETFGGDDKVYAGKGHDVVELGSGDDYVRVGGGQEEFHGGSGVDYISYYDSTGGVTVNLATNEVSGSWAANDVISGFERISGSGTGGDTIFGTSGANTIKTFGGDDKVYAGKGHDVVELGSGDDYVRVGGGQESFDGGSGTDYISYYDSTGGITIDLAANTVSGSWGANDQVRNFESVSGSGTGNDRLYGTSGQNKLKGFGGDDRLYGRGGDDKLYGGAGEDRFDGGAGMDTLHGGAGADTFHFDHGEDHDVIKDFENNVDTIELDNFSFAPGEDAFDFATQVGNDVVFDFGGGDMLTVENATIGQLYNDLDLV